MMYNEYVIVSSRSQMFFKRDVLHNFAVFTRKRLCCSLFWESRLKACNFINCRLQHMHFTVNIANLLLFSSQKYKNTCVFIIISKFTIHNNKKVSQKVQKSFRTRLEKNESAKLRGLRGNGDYVGPWVAWVRGSVGPWVAWVNFLRGLRGLRGSRYFLRGSIFYVGHNFYVGCVGPKFFAWVFAWVNFYLLDAIIFKC